MKTIRKLVLTAAAATTLVAGGILIGGRIEAAPIGSPDGIGAAIDGLNLAERAQFILSGHRYCWYDDAWQGPGWYWCGYGWRRGLGWGGGEGWQGWTSAHRGERNVERRHSERDLDRTRHGERNVDRGPRSSEGTVNGTRTSIGQAPSSGGHGPGNAATSRGAGSSGGGAGGEHREGGAGNDRR